MPLFMTTWKLKGQQEIRNSAVKVRRNPEMMLKVLEEACGHPPLVKAQKLCLTGSRGGGGVERCITVPCCRSEPLKGG